MIFKILFSVVTAAMWTQHVSSAEYLRLKATKGTLSRAEFTPIAALEPEPFAQAGAGDISSFNNFPGVEADAFNGVCFEKLFASVGTATNCVLGDSPQQNLFGMDSDMAYNGLFSQNQLSTSADNVPYLGTLNLWVPYYDSLDDAVRVRNNQMLAPLIASRMNVAGVPMDNGLNAELWLGGMEISVVPKAPLQNDNVVSLFVAHNDSAWSQGDQATVLKMLSQNGPGYEMMQEYLCHYANRCTETNGQRDCLCKDNQIASQLENLPVLEFFGMPWSRLPKETALKANVEWTEKWLSNTQRSELAEYASVLRESPQSRSSSLRKEGDSPTFQMIQEQWSNDESNGLVYRGPDMLNKYSDLISAVQTYGECGVISRTSPPLSRPGSCRSGEKAMK